MNLIWTPAPGDFPASDALIISQEHETNISAEIIVTVDEGQPPKTLIWSMPDGAPSNMRVHTVANKLTLDIINWVGLFPIEINYMQDADPVQTQKQTDNWDDLPAEDADVFALIPDTKNVRHYRFVVEAYSSTNQLMGAAIYTITVYANYTIGRDLLKAAVQKRKDA